MYKSAICFWKVVSSDFSSVVLLLHLFPLRVIFSVKKRTSARHSAEAGDCLGQNRRTGANARDMYIACFNRNFFPLGSFNSNWENCCCSVTQSCLTLFDPIDCSMPGIPVYYHLLELAQTHVHQVSYAIQPSSPLSPASAPAFNLS